MLLEELFIRVVSDTLQVDRGVDDSKKKANELTTSLKNVEGQADKTGAGFVSFAAKAAGAFAAVFSVSRIIDETFARAETIDTLSRTSEALGIAIEDLDAFGKAAERAGGDAQGARDSLTDMAEAMGEALSDKESGRAKAFQALGISIKDVNGKAKDGLTGILDLAKAVEGMDKSQAVFKIKELGITDNRTVEMILKGRVELERMLKVQKEQGVVSKESAENSKRLTESLNILKASTANAGNSFIDMFIPAMTKVIEWLVKVSDWAHEHKDVVIGFFAAISAVVLALYLPAMISAAAATLAATWPIIAIGAAVVAVAAAFALAYEDIMNFIDGNDSLIGQIFDQYPMVKTIIMGLIDAFTWWGKIVAGVWISVYEGFKAMLDFVMRGISQITSGISSFASFFGFGGDGAQMEEASKQLAIADGASANGITSNAISNSVAGGSETNVQVGQITVQTQATDAQGMASAATSELQGQLKDLGQQSSTGVAR